MFSIGFYFQYRYTLHPPVFNIYNAKTNVKYCKIDFMTIAFLIV